MDSRRLMTAAGVLSVFLLFAYFGQELVNHITRSEVRAEAWYERNAPPRSGRLELAPSSPQQLTARYPAVTLADLETLLDRPAYRNRRLGRRDLPRIERLIRNQGPDHTFVFLTRLQDDFARLNGLLPPGSMDSLVRALSQSPHFRTVYRGPGAWIFEPREAAQ
jgi:hypothetical protein